MPFYESPFLHAIYYVVKKCFVADLPGDFLDCRVYLQNKCRGFVFEMR